MSKQLKPVILHLDREDGKFYPNKMTGDSKHLCIPLTPASRKRMIEAIQKAVTDEWLGANGNEEYSMQTLAEAALDALEKMAGDTK